MSLKMNTIVSFSAHGKLHFHRIVFISLLLFAYNGSCTQENGPIVNTRNGKLRGKFMHVAVNNTVAAYLGIPYAEVTQRFAAPSEVLPWDQETKMATTFGPSCYHSDDEVFPGFPGAEMWNAPNRKAEDCLSLNVWAPLNNNQTSDLLPVMVWIYGGSFYSGTSALKVYDGRYLAASGQVVVVSLNYRLGPLGFMPPLDKETPSNVGLLDQNFALRWVKENIDAFGGDPNSITLFGESAGAASIGLHAVSPLSKGLFHRIILQSASQTALWATISLKESMARAQELGRNLGCSLEGGISEKKLLMCLREKTAEEIFNASWITAEIFDFPFVPVHGTPFIPDHPMQLTREGKLAKVDVLAGYNSNEGFYFALYTIPGFSLNTSSLLTKPEYKRGIELSGLRTNDLGRSAVEFMYDDWEYPTNLARYRDALDSIIGHFHVTCPVINAAKHQASIFPSKNVFLYHFAYRISNNPWPAWMEVMHGYEIELVFGLPFLFPEEYNNSDRDVSRRMVKAWINFAKYGNPGGFGSNVTPWPQYNANTQTYVEISSLWDSFLTPTPHSMQCAFWEHYLPSLELASGEFYMDFKNPTFLRVVTYSTATQPERSYGAMNHLSSQIQKEMLKFSHN